MTTELETRDARNESLVKGQLPEALRLMLTIRVFDEHALAHPSCLNRKARSSPFRYGSILRVSTFWSGPDGISQEKIAS